MTDKTALREAILTLLTNTAAPMPTPAIVNALHEHGARDVIYKRLIALENAGEIERITQPHRGSTAVWQRTADPERELAAVFERWLADATDDEGDELGWQAGALCAQTDPEAFFPEKGGSTREAKRICQGCDVRAECLEYALAHDERFGIWGGMSERERRKLKKSRAA